MDNEIIENRELLSQFLMQFQDKFALFLRTKLIKSSNSNPFDAALEDEAKSEDWAEEIISEVIEGKL